MLNPYLSRRSRSANRPHKPAQAILRLESLETRQLLNGSGNGIVQDPASAFTAGFLANGNLHSFKVTEVAVDSDNDGLVNTRNLTFVGFIEGPGGFHAGDLNVNALIGGNTFSDLNPSFDAGTGRLSFTIDATLANTTADQSVTFEVARAGFGAFPIRSFVAGNPTGPNLTGTFTVATPGVPSLTNASGPGTLTRNLPTFSVGNAEGAGRIRLVRNGAAIGTGTTITDVLGSGATVSVSDGTNLADGDYTYAARFVSTTDVVGQQSGTRSITLDRTAPSIPTALAQTTTSTANAPQFQFTASTDTNGIARYEAVFDGATMQALGLNTTFAPGALIAPGSHTVQVRAIDNAGNVGNLSASIEFVLTNETISNLRLVNTTGPAGPPPLTRDAQLTFNGISDTANLTQYEFSVNAGAFQSFNANTTFTPIGLLQGPNHVDVRAVLTGNSLLGPIGLDFVFDSIAPTAPTDLALTTDSGTSPDRITNVGQLQFTASTDATSGVRNYLTTTNGGPAQDINLSTTFTPAGLINGTNVIQVTAFDQAGNASPTATATIFFDTTNPIVAGLKIASADQVPGTSLLPVPQTATSNPRIEFKLTDATFATQGNPVRVRLLKSNVALDTQTVTLVAGSDGTLTVDVSLQAVNLTPGDNALRVEATDAAGNVTTSSAFNLFVTRPTDPTPGAPSTPVFTTLWDLSKPLAPDDAKTLFGVAPPVELGGIQPWTQAFDRTTQTIWFSNEQADRVAQFDPATGMINVYQVDLPNASGDGTATNPHGVFFDFESHLTPRVWFVYRNKRGASDLDDSRVSYLDLAKNELVTFDLSSLAKNDDLKGSHFITVDRRGHIWITLEESGQLIEIDLSTKPDGTPTSSLDSRTGRVTVHQLPAALGDRVVNGVTTESPFHIHGLDVVVADDGRTFVWITDAGGRLIEGTSQPTPATGRFALLLPGRGDGGGDRWYEWDVDAALDRELGVVGDGQFRRSQLSFVTVDTNETPGFPEDDRIIVADPGFLNQSPSNSAGIVRVFDASTFLSSIRDGGAVPATSPIMTVQVPKLPGTAVNRPFAATAQPFVDREGNIFFVDQLGGVGRFNPADRTDYTIQAPIRTFNTTPVRDLPITFTAISNTIESGTLQAKFLTNQAQTRDNSQVTGIDQYEVAAGTTTTRGDGPFRGILGAGSVLYGSLAEGNVFSSTVFAEVVRRPMAVTTGAGTARQAFQVVRNGHLVMTYRGNGELIEHQIDLTQAYGLPPILGDPSAVTDADGTVHLFGRDPQGGLLEFRIDPLGRSASAQSISGIPLGVGILAASPTAFILNRPTPVIGSLSTTSQGHLLFVVPNGVTIDLTAEVGGADALVYSSVGATESGGNAYIYGTNQKGGLVEFKIPLNGGPITHRQVNLPAARDTMVFQDVEVITTADGVRHIFATDGNSRLVEVMVGPTGDSARNLTVENQSRANGYSAYQNPFAGRLYSDVDLAIDPTNGDLYVYGTNGRDLIEYVNHQGTWQITNLTNNLAAGVFNFANRLFGSPSVTFQPNGDRQILMISEDAEVIAYTKSAASLFFNTANLTLALGNTGSPLNIRNPVPVGPTVPVPPAATPFTFDAAGLTAAASGFNQAANDKSFFLYKARFTGRVAFTVGAPTTGFGLGLIPRISVSNGKRAVKAVGRRNAEGTQVSATVTFRVIKGRTYFIGIQGARRSVGAFSLIAKPR